ncbi:hypothetical protein, partial [Micromonospora aurantiaca (nom. illeg.)]|uniref:hypothetical protein n=1 Tax=Micromonospora aurantiaca (nom. illeg.) TaxID=47850 RepID=UPI00365AF6F8
MIDAAGRGRATWAGATRAGATSVAGGHGGLGWMGAVSGLRRVSGFGVVGDTRLAESWAGPGRYT